MPKSFDLCQFCKVGVGNINLAALYESRACLVSKPPFIHVSPTMQSSNPEVHFSGNILSGNVRTPLAEFGIKTNNSVPEQIMSSNRRTTIFHFYPPPPALVHLPNWRVFDVAKRSSLATHQSSLRSLPLHWTSQTRWLQVEKQNPQTQISLASFIAEACTQQWTDISYVRLSRNQTADSKKDI